MENRKDFYADEMIYERMDAKLNDVAKTLTLKEILKMIREISYDMICYYSEDNKGIIYQSDKYSELNREQACRLQRLLSTACDLFGQSIINHREFEEGYLNKYLNGGSMENQIEDLKNEIESLKEERRELNQRIGELEDELQSN